MLGITDPIPTKSVEAYSKLILDYVNKSYEIGKVKAKLLVDINHSTKSYAFPLADFDKHVGISELINVRGDSFTTNYIQSNTFKASERTMARINTNLKNKIIDAYTTNKGIKYIGREVNKEYTQLKRYEANRISRTEINSAQNKGIYDQYNELGITFIQWITHPNAKTRLTHKQEDGKIILTGYKFNNGLLYPGDKNGPIEEWINCRCTTAPWYPKYNNYTIPNNGTIEFSESDIKFDNDSFNGYTDFKDLEKKHYYGDLTRKDEDIIRNYTKDSTEYNVYLGTGKLPERLRNPKTPQLEKKINEFLDEIDDLQELLNRGKLVEDTIFYSGQREKYMPQIANIKKGDIFKTNKFLSTSYNKKIAKDFNEGKVVLKIYADKGNRGRYVKPKAYKPHANEEEYLFPRLQKFEVLNTYREKGIKIIELVTTPEIVFDGKSIYMKKIKDNTKTN